MPGRWRSTRRATFTSPESSNVSKEEIAEIIKYLRYSQKAAGLEPEDEDEEGEEG